MMSTADRLRRAFGLFLPPEQAVLAADATSSGWNGNGENLDNRRTDLGLLDLMHPMTNSERERTIYGKIVD
jgi:hypothetical protein